MTEIKKKSQVLIALGANVPPEGGALSDTLDRALQLLDGIDETALVRSSRWYRTPAYPPGSGPDFLNGAALLESLLAPEAMLAALHDVETRLGRERPTRWAPRTCDLDMTAYGDLILPDRETLARWMALDLGKAQSLVPPRLILPHPRMHERGFVLVPLAEIAPGWRHPALGLTAAEMCDGLPVNERAAIRPLS
ncbi:MAG TPA: 2-amino-4-hydroxy-6-hydroxymethyldihydropteridine diphosphokinase [Thermohalobaculum sp.]|nr:2-amino-4-hydroxy-6-hydroxymethyldihydropteridine diphosphokinase [Thermohalobaculum sp.]